MQTLTLPNKKDVAVECSSQPFIFSDETMAEITDAEQRGEYTLERLKELRPEVIEEIIRLRSEYVGMLRVAKLVHVHHKTVSAVDVAYADRIGDGRQRAVRLMRSASEKMIEQINESPESVPWNVKALAVSQLIDKAELLDGKATSRVEHVETVDIYSDWNGFVESMCDPQKSIDIETSKLPSLLEIGSEAEKDFPI